VTQEAASAGLWAKVGTQSFATAFLIVNAYCSSFFGLAGMSLEESCNLRIEISPRTCRRGTLLFRDIAYRHGDHDHVAEEVKGVDQVPHTGTFRAVWRVLLSV